MIQRLLRAFQIGLLFVPATMGSLDSTLDRASAQSAGGTPTPSSTLPPGPIPSPTLPPGPILSPTLPPGPIPSPTLPPGPMYQQQLNLYTKVNGHWKATRTLLLSSPARFTISFSSHALKNPSVKLDITPRSTSTVLYRLPMHKTSVVRGRIRFQATLTVKKSRALGHDSAKFIVFEGSRGVVAFSLPFTTKRHSGQKAF